MSSTQAPPSVPPAATSHVVHRVCPSCLRELDPEATVEAARLPRCPEHGLAFIAEHDLPKAGSDVFLGKTLVERFVILARLGAGSMGAVYRARQEAVGRDVALKIVRRDRAYDPETKARFEREARAMSSLTSPHTVTVFDFGEADDGSWFLAMEMLEGETLGERLRREGALPWSRAARIASEALKSLAEAHSKGIIHRDLKPDNLFLMRRTPGSTNEAGEMCKVLDFGIAKLQHDDQKLDQLETQAGTVFGTPRYMSPEQAQGAELDARSDLYSLGVILFQMLSGRAPFVDGDAVVVMARHIKDAPPGLAQVAPDVHVPVSLERVVLRALAKSPAARIQSAERFIADLEEAAMEASSEVQETLQATTTAALTPVARPAPPPSTHSKSYPQGLLLAAALVAGVVLIGVSVGVVFLLAPPLAPSSQRVDEGIPLGVPATIPHQLSEPIANKSTISRLGSSSATSAEQANPGAAAPPASASAPAGPPTQVKQRPRGFSSGPPKGSVDPETMEPKRPEERYGRFR